MCDAVVLITVERKVDLRNKKPFIYHVFKQSLIHKMHNLHTSFDFDANISEKLHFFIKQCYIISKFSLK